MIVLRINSRLRSVNCARLLLRPTPAELPPFAVKVVVATWRINLGELIQIFLDVEELPDTCVVPNAESHR